VIKTKWSILIVNGVLRVVESHWISAKKCVRARARTMSILSNVEIGTYELFFVKKSVLSAAAPV